MAFSRQEYWSGGHCLLRGTNVRWIHNPILVGQNSQLLAVSDNSTCRPYLASLTKSLGDSNELSVQILYEQQVSVKVRNSLRIHSYLLGIGIAYSIWFISHHTPDK